MERFFLLSDPPNKPLWNVHIKDHFTVSKALTKYERPKMKIIFGHLYFFRALEQQSE